MNIGIWNAVSLTGKEVELVEEVKKHLLEIIGSPLTKKKGNGTVVLQDGWQLFYSGVKPSTHAQAGVELLISPRIIDPVVEWKSIKERMALLKLHLRKKILAVIQVYAPNVKSNCSEFLDNVSQVMESIPSTNATLIMGHFNAHVGNDSTTWQSIISPNGNNDLNPQDYY